MKVINNKGRVDERGTQNFLFINAQVESLADYSM